MGKKTEYLSKSIVKAEESVSYFQEKLDGAKARVKEAKAALKAAQAEEAKAAKAAAKSK